jgi:hypothetical protein
VDARNSIVAGNSNTCVGIYNFVGGNGSIAGRQAVFGFTPVISSIALGDVAIAAGNAAVALGNSTLAVADSSYSFGNVSKALFRQATALGSFTEASARAAMAVNYYSEARGNYALSANDHSVAIGTASAAWGSYTNAKGAVSMALGENTNAKGDMSVAVGQRTIATGFASLAAGVFNDSIVAEQSSLAVNTPLFVVGNGDNTATRTNALVVRRNGVGIGLNQPAAVLGVEGSFATRGNIVQINNLVNHDVTPGRNSFIKVTNAVNNFTITGFEGGTNGRILTVINLSGFNMTIANDHPISTAGNRILTLKGADISTVGAGSVTLQYSSADSRWLVIHMRE